MVISLVLHFFLDELAEHKFQLVLFRVRIWSVLILLLVHGQSLSFIRLLLHKKLSLFLKKLLLIIKLLLHHELIRNGPFRMVLQFLPHHLVLHDFVECLVVYSLEVVRWQWRSILLVIIVGLRLNDRLLSRPFHLVKVGALGVLPDILVLYKLINDLVELLLFFTIGIFLLSHPRETGHRSEIGGCTAILVWHLYLLHLCETVISLTKTEHCIISWVNAHGEFHLFVAIFHFFQVYCERMFQIIRYGCVFKLMNIIF